MTEERHPEGFSSMVDTLPGRGSVEVMACKPLLILRNPDTGCLIGFDLADLDELIGVLNVFRMSLESENDNDGDE